MLCYLDRTFCVFQKCANKDCKDYLSKEHIEKAKKLNLPISIADCSGDTECFIHENSLSKNKE